MGMFLPVWPIFACTTVDLEKFRHGMPLTDISDAVDDESVFVTSWTDNASAAIH